MVQIEIYKRLTHRYRAGWVVMDEHQYVGPLKLTAPRVTQEGEDGTGPTRIRHARLSAEQARDPRTVRDIIDGLYDTVGGSTCRHEHDCCGCARTGVEVRKVSRRDLVIRTRVWFNV